MTAAAERHPDRPVLAGAAAAARALPAGRRRRMIGAAREPARAVGGGPGRGGRAALHPRLPGASTSGPIRWPASCTRPLEVVPAVSVAPLASALLFPDARAQPLRVRLKAGAAEHHRGAAPRAAGRLSSPSPPACRSSWPPPATRSSWPSPSRPPRGKARPPARCGRWPRSGPVDEPPLAQRVELHRIPAHPHPDDAHRGRGAAGAGRPAPRRASASATSRAPATTSPPAWSGSATRWSSLDEAAPDRGAAGRLRRHRAGGARLQHQRPAALPPRPPAGLRAQGAAPWSSSTTPTTGSADLAGGHGPPALRHRPRPGHRREARRSRFEQPTHAVLNQPNKITPADFEGWVQERGLYFASNWDKGYETPLSMTDPGEDTPLQGQPAGRPPRPGAFVYTGLAFFRQLPAGVPGAYRLFANLIAHGRNTRLIAARGVAGRTAALPDLAEDLRPGAGRAGGRGGPLRRR